MSNEENKIHSFRVADLNTYEVWYEFLSLSGSERQTEKTEQVTRYNSINNPLNTTVNVLYILFNVFYNVYIHNSLQRLVSQSIR
jgi:hypothetical protein